MTLHVRREKKMSIKEIEYGALASSSELNDNFHYLENEVGKLSDLITSKTASFASNVATLNATIKEFLYYLLHLYEA